MQSTESIDPVHSGRSRRDSLSGVYFIINGICRFSVNSFDGAGERHFIHLLHLYIYFVGINSGDSTPCRCTGKENIDRSGHAERNWCLLLIIFGFVSSC